MKRLLTILFLLQLLQAFGQDYYQVDEFFSTDGLFNRGYFLESFAESDGTIFVFGELENINVLGGSVNRLNPDGSILNVLSSSSGFAVPYQFGGGFMVRNFASFRQFTYDWEPNWDFNFIYNTEQFDLGYNIAHDLIEWSDGTLVAAGRWTVDTLVPLEEGLASLVKVDQFGNPADGFSPIFLEENPNLDFYQKYLLSLDTNSLGEIILAGRFNQIAGHPYHHLAKLTNQFEVDLEFGNVLSTFGEARVGLIDSQNRIWLYLLSAIAEEAPEYEFVIRLLPNGEIDYSYEHPELIIDLEDFPPMESWPRKIHELPDGTFLFTGGIIEADGLPCKNLVHITESGEVIDDFWRLTGPDEAVWQGWDQDPWTGNLVFLENGDILIDGHFSSWDGHPTSNIVKLNPMTIGIEENESNRRIRAYPNPTSETISIDYPISKSASIEILNLSGQLISEHIITPTNHTIDISQLDQGLYLIRLEEENGKVAVGKFVKE